MSNLDTALGYIEQTLGTPYGWWRGGPVPDEEPAWAINGPPPEPWYVKERTCFCAGVANLMRRSVRKRVPDSGGGVLYDGGTLAYGEYFWNYSEWFDIHKALTGGYPRGTLIGRYFSKDRLPSDQGHVAILLRDGWVLQSYDAGGGLPGVNWDVHISDSHAGWYYEWACLPENWIEYEGWDEF